MDKQRRGLETITPSKEFADKVFESARKEAGAKSGNIVQVFNFEQTQSDTTYQTAYGFNPIYTRIRANLNAFTVPGFTTLYGKRIVSIKATMVAYRDPSNLDQFNIVKLGNETLWYQKTNEPNRALSGEIDPNLYGFFVFDDTDSVPNIRIEAPYVFQVNNAETPPAGGTAMSVQVVVKVAIECDGAEWHDAERDAERDRKLKNEGWTIYRVPGSVCLKSLPCPAELKELELDEEEFLTRVHAYNTTTARSVVMRIKEKHFVKGEF